MFQNTPRPTDPSQDQNKQDQQKRDQEQKAANLTDEVRSRIQRDAETRSFESKALAITGRLNESRITERSGASAQSVTQVAEQQAMLNVDHDLSQLEVPLAEDTRWTVRDAARRAIMQHASEVEAQRAETRTDTDKGL
jgi:hypothetical protein